MTNKDIVKEIVWLLIAGGISFFLTVLLMQPRYDTMIGSMLKLDGLISDIAFKLRLLLMFLAFFPLLFLLISVRELTKRQKRRPQNIYLLFICFMSLLSSLVWLVYLKPLATILFGSWTIYPPLSAMPDEFSPPKDFNIYLYALLAFITLQITVATVICRLVFKK